MLLTATNGCNLQGALLRRKLPYLVPEPISKGVDTASAMCSCRQVHGRPAVAHPALRGAPGAAPHRPLRSRPPPGGHHGAGAALPPAAAPAGRGAAAAGAGGGLPPPRPRTPTHGSGAARHAVLRRRACHPAWHAAGGPVRQRAGRGGGGGAAEGREGACSYADRSCWAHALAAAVAPAAATAAAAGA